MRTVLLRDAQGDLWHADVSDPLPRSIRWGSLTFRRIYGVLYEEEPYFEVFDTRSTQRIPK